MASPRVAHLLPPRYVQLWAQCCSSVARVCHNNDVAVSPARLVRGLIRVLGVRDLHLVPSQRHSSNLASRNIGTAPSKLHTLIFSRTALGHSGVAVLLELTELAKPVERPCLCCNTQLC